ncbi:sterile20-like kinase isoform b [Anaeramoeba flamelloides]|uniref:Sterile20-like kinase isoform b n=1 Tax=Anaeramoeba flamelloides TaxID=1746091 RepID=A0AAV7ZPW6_9EUKA|nr:sterile20-like kinase isoform b [Anaeramoeba flamelloides]
MELSEEELKNKINEFTNNYAVVLFNILGKQIHISVDWESFENAKKPQRAMEALYSWNGYFVFGRLIEVIEEFAVKYDGKSDIEDLLDAIVIQCVNKGRTVDLDGTNLIVKSNFSKGSMGALKKKRLKKLIGNLFRLTTKSYRKLIEQVCIPRAQQELRETLELTEEESDIEFEVDWESFGRSEDLSDALSNLTYYSGWYSFRNIARAFRYAIRYDEISKKKLKKLFTKVRFVHIPGRGYKKKKAFVEKSTIVIYGQWEYWWGGYLSTYDLQALLRHAVKLKKLEKKKKENKMNKDQVKKKIKLLRDVAESYYIRHGHLQYLEWVLSSPIFQKPDKLDSKAFNIFMTKFVNKENKENEEEKKKKKKKKKKEKFIYGRPIKKINQRGSRQDRLFCITNKSLYTFNYNYKKSKVLPKTIHIMPHKKWWYCRYGELSSSGGFGGDLAKKGGDKLNVNTDNVQKVSEGVGEIANLVSDKEFGVNFISNYRLKKPNPLLKKVAKQLGPKILMVFDKLVETQIEGKENLPAVHIPESPKFELSDIFKIIGKSLAKEDVKLPLITFDGFPPASLLDVIALLEETWDKTASQPDVKLPNLPTIDIAWLLKNALNTMREMKDLEFEFPQQPSLKKFFENIFDSMQEKAEESLGDIELPPPESIGLVKLLNVLKESIENFEEKVPKLKVAKQKLPEMLVVIETLIKVSEEVPVINFPPPKSLKILRILEIINNVIGVIDLPSVSFDGLDIDFGIELPKLPSVDIDLPGGKFLKYLQPAKKPPHEAVMYYPREKSDKHLCKELCYIHRAIAMCNNSPSWVSRPYKTKINYNATTFGQLLNKTSRGKTNKHKVKKDKKNENSEESQEENENEIEKEEINENEEEKENQEEKEKENKEEKENSDSDQLDSGSD